MKLQWQNEKKIIDEIRKLKQSLEEQSIEETRYEREGNLSKAAEIKHGMIPEVQRKLDAKSKELERSHGEQSLLREGSLGGGYCPHRLQLDGDPGS